MRNVLFKPGPIDSTKDTARSKKRRIKCDTQIPCKECTARGLAHLCRKETVIVKGRIVSDGDDKGDLDERLKVMSKEELWGQVQGLMKENEGLKMMGTGASGAKIHPSSENRSQSKHAPQNDDLSNMARRLGFLHESSCLSIDPPNIDNKIDDCVTFPSGLQLPSQETSYHLLSYVFTHLGWLLCPIPSSFQDQASFIFSPDSPSPFSHLHTAKSLAEARPSWSVLSFALISVALVYAPAELLEGLGIGVEQRTFFARLWFRAAVSTMLDGGSCLVNPSMIQLQTFCVLTLLFQPFDYMALHDTLLASMIQVARMLGLHLLKDSTMERTASSEIGRRVWAFLLAREVHYTGESYCPSVSREEQEPFASFLNISEPDTIPLIPLPLSHPTRVSYLLAGSRMTALTRDIKRLPPDADYAEVLKMDERIRDMNKDMEWLEKDDASHPAWVATARHVLFLKTCQRRLYLHRHYFSLTATHPQYAPSRLMSLQAASDICLERFLHDLPFDDKLDTINGVLPAAIVLLLDAIYPLKGERLTFGFVIQRCEEVERLLAPIRFSTYRSSTQTINITLKSVDRLLADTLQAAQAAEIVRASWTQLVLQPGGDTFGDLLDGLSFGSLLDSFEDMGPVGSA
ncbi:hypothetical protein L198_06639 [Cryptococcus wingfieldii CBS 7118]|uniref:Transcription factor domain-containing protein n=1 Tax=Cryptococcus wingfieldii CBS 7118 TaxID=1295528 RepID=A0A1E3IJQ7_9TREE|nr:hypothetical protein L198_06639 [Cryptococcus wingfieldii CBS 7118]ODN88837.1 hypothetical protein L198_06639 [Cryptococcus wingfieldii CBS 7118]